MSYEGGPMTEAMYYILLALVNPNHGYQLMNNIEQISKGRLNMGPGTLYGVLSRLESDELIVVIDNQGRRKVYEITEDGKDALKKEYKRLCNMIADGAFLKGGV